MRELYNYMLFCQEIGCYFMNRSTEYYPESLIQEIGKSILDLINRQKAEILELQKRIINWRADMDYRPDEIKSEAIKEFAERLKEKLQWDVEFDNKIVFESDIDNLVKEMEGSE